MKRPPFTALAETLPETVPFVGPETLERRRGRPFRARIGANESIFGPSPKAVTAMSEAAAGSWRYCDPENYDLKHAIGAHHGVPPECIVVGEGIDGLLALTVRLFAGPGDPVVTSAGSYPTFAFHVAGYGAKLVVVPFKDDKEDPETLLAAAAREKARLVYIANPDNPMGTWWSADTISSMIDRLPPDAVLCLDEAYIELAPDGTAPAFGVNDPRVIRFRTFSKAYGMAGLRVGYAITEASIARAFNKIRNHFGVNRVAQIGAQAALADEPHTHWVIEQVKKARDRIVQIGAEHGLEALPSATNFVTLDCKRDGDFVRRLLETFAERDIFVRMPGIAPLDRCIRISTGTDEDLDMLAEVLGPAIKAAEK
jgi:histidinol-phosphate aminotransferase